jgi:hypothetical protein
MKINKVVLAISASFAIVSAHTHAATTTYYSGYATPTTFTAGPTYITLTTPIPTGTALTISYTANYVSGSTTTPNVSAGVLLLTSTAPNVIVGRAGATSNVLGVTTPTAFSYTVTPTGVVNIIAPSFSGMTSSGSTPTTYSFSNLLIIGNTSGPSSSDTQTSLTNTANALQGIYALQNAVIVNGFSYDCSLFDTKGMCISAGARRSNVQGEGVSNNAGLVIVAYRPNPNMRIGAYMDQNITASSPGETVAMVNKIPVTGLFGIWSEKIDGTGTEVKVSLAYGSKYATIQRAVVGTSEAGNGSSSLNTQGAEVTAKYSFNAVEDTVVSPYVGLRYTQNRMAGYVEKTSTSVTAPLSYANLNTNATTATAGVNATYKARSDIALLAGVGVETDIGASNGSVSATGITGLTAINFNSTRVKTRASALLGAYYDLKQSQRVSVTAFYRQEAYQSVSTTSLMATYTAGF